MSKYVKQLTGAVLLVFFAVTIAGCGGDSTSVAQQTPLWCKAPHTITADGTSCELVLSACNYPEVADEQGLCVMDMNQWIPGANGIELPEPEYVVGAGEIVIYWALEDSSYDDWGLHAWNNDSCNSYADFERPSGGTDWTAPIMPTGIDPNYGAYWVMNIIEPPNCVNFIPHNLVIERQTADLTVDLYTAMQNPTGRFFVLDGYEEQYIFSYPRTFESLIVPGGSTLSCEAPQILNEAGDECIDPPSDVFIPGEATLYARGSFNGWEAQDDYQFSYSNNVYTLVLPLAAQADAYEFKIADTNWSGPTSFGTLAAEENVVLGEAKTLTVTEGQNIRITVSDAANYQLTFDATDPAAPVLTVVTVTYDKVMFLKGSMNEWSNTHPMDYLGDNIYRLEYTLEAADYEFKIADANWTEATNFGAAEGDQDLSLDVAKTLVFGEGIAMNIKMSIAGAGTYRFTLDASVPESPILTVVNAIPYGDKVMYLKGTMNDWGGNLDGFAFDYGDNHYRLTATIPAGSHEFKIADIDWTGTSTLGAMTDDGAVVVGEAKTLTLPGDNLTLVVAEDTTFNFDVDATDKNAPLLTVSQSIPYGDKVLYLKGSMNDWGGFLDGFAFAYADNHYTLMAMVPAGNHEFKIADIDWTGTSTLGAMTDDGAVVVGEAKTLTLPGDNLTLPVSEDRLFRFDLDATDAAAPILTVSPYVPFQGRTLYLKGTMNSWGGDLAGYEFSATAAAIYTLTVSLPVAAYEFKIADLDWQDDSTLGAMAGSEAMTLGTPNTLTLPGDGNMTLEIGEEKEYTFTLDASTPSMPILTIE